MSSNTSFEEAVAEIKPVYDELVKFLITKANVKITNAKYMGCYTIITKCSDCSSQENEISSFPTKNGSPIKNLSKPEVSEKSNEDKLFDYFKSLVKEFTEKQKGEVVKVGEDQAFLEKVIENWKDYMVYLHWMGKLFYYLDMFFTKGKNTSCPMEGFLIYRDNYFSEIKEKLTKIILGYVACERNEQKIPGELVKSIVSYFNIMGYESDVKVEKNQSTNEFYFTGRLKVKDDPFSEYYKKHFQTALSDTTMNYYQNKVQVEWLKVSTPEYVTIALKCLQEEEVRADNYYPNSKKLIIKQIEKIIIENQAQALAGNEHSGVLSMLQKHKRDELKEIYLLFNRVPDTVQQIANKYQKYLEDIGKSFNEDQVLNKNPIEYIKKVLEHKEQSDELINNIFENDLTITKARDMAFKGFLNSFDRSARFLAINCDNEFKKGIKGNTEQEIESKFSQIINIFRFLYSRDAFLKDYTKYLSSRLLNSTSLNDESENLMLSKLKNECGTGSVSKIVKMRLDIKESRDEMQNFIKFLDKEKLNLKNIELNAKVLTGGCWPEFTSTSKCVVPAELKDLTEGFNKFYTEKYNQARNISWIWSEGNAEITAKFDKSYSLQVSNFQLIVLLALNNSNSESFESLLERTGVSEVDFVSHMDFLFQLKLVVRSKGINDKFDPGERIAINKDFTNNQKRFICLRPKAPVQQAKPGMVARSAPDTIENESLEQERGNYIDAAAVRVMKARKNIKIHELMSEVVRLITLFRPQPAQIKRRIESLIERGYIKRSDEDFATLIYLP